MTEEPLAHQIAESLRRDILLGNLRPGERIKERDTSAGQGVSRTPLREALRILANEGLVVLRPSRSPVVANPSLTQINDDLVVMRALEILGARLACGQATARELADIEALHHAMLRLSASGDALGFFETDMRFHKAITAASHNASLIDTHAAYMARLWRPRFLAASQQRDRPRVLRQHADMLRGLQLGDVVLVSAEIESHLQYLGRNINDILTAPDPAPTPAEAG